MKNIGEGAPFHTQAQGPSRVLPWCKLSLYLRHPMVGFLLYLKWSYSLYGQELSLRAWIFHVL